MRFDADGVLQERELWAVPVSNANFTQDAAVKATEALPQLRIDGSWQSRFSSLCMQVVGETS
jgi:hypothetical protein